MVNGTERTLYEQQLIRDAIDHPGVKLLFNKLDALVEIQKTNQLECDPYTSEGISAIKRAQEFRYIVKVFFPKIIEGLINFDADAPDKQAPPQKRWSLFQWLTR
jgi:hypothetical protein